MKISYYHWKSCKLKWNTVLLFLHFALVIGFILFDSLLNHLTERNFHINYFAVLIPYHLSRDSDIYHDWNADRNLIKMTNKSILVKFTDLLADSLLCYPTALLCWCLATWWWSIASSLLHLLADVPILWSTSIAHPWPSLWTTLGTTWILWCHWCTHYSSTSLLVSVVIGWADWSSINTALGCARVALTDLSRDIETPLLVVNLVLGLLHNLNRKCI